jgi:hypothetical protein
MYRLISIPFLPRVSVFDTLHSSVVMSRTSNAMDMCMRFDCGNDLECPQVAVEFVPGQ